MSKGARVVIWPALLLALLLAAITPVLTQARLLAEPAPEWDALFDRSDGWTGADGIYSIPLSGIDRPVAQPNSTTLFVFGDTFIGGVGSTDQRLAGTTLVNNTAALLRGNAPDPNAIRFYWDADNPQPAALVTPVTPSTEPGDWYWFLDGLALQRDLYQFAMRMGPADGGVFNFRTKGVTLLRAPIAAHPLQMLQQTETPLFVPASGQRGELIYGGALMANTQAAGAPHADGYLYVYGTQNDAYNKKLIAARLLPEFIEDFSAWRFWDGQQWSANPQDAAPITGRISSEFSVTPLADGRYVLVFQLDGLGRDVAMRIGTSPVGPFGAAISVWSCPEPELDPDIFTYNAKAHPHLSAPGELLISYNVNTFDFPDHFRHADIYRPRFIRVRLSTLQ